MSCSRPASRSRLGIDLGGTKIEALLLCADNMERWRKRIATPRSDYAATLAAIQSLVEEARGVARSLSLCEPTIGIGTPGAISQRTGLVKNANSTCLNGQPLLHDLEAKLGCKIRTSNDANCMLVSEARDGAAYGASSAFGVILGTGVGGALMLEGQLVEGYNRIGGEWGHNALPWPSADELPGPLCYCARRGCIETWLSGPGFLANYRKRGGHATNVPEIVAKAQLSGSPEAKALDQYCDQLARGLASVINLFDPEVIVLAGGLSNIEALYQEVPKRWGQYIFSDDVSTRLQRNRHGDSSGVRGAAWLWDDLH
jgi:fructokinase